MSILPGNKAPWFSSIGFQENKFSDISLTDFSSAGNWLVLFFYPLDFGYVTPSELLALEERRTELESLGCKVVAVSTNSVVVHERFASVNKGYGGVFGIKFPLMEDKNGTISRQYGVMKEEGSGHSYRAYFIIDNDQIVRARVVGDLPVALGMDEMVRQVKSLKLATTGVYVDGEGNEISKVEFKYDVSDSREAIGILSTDFSYYNSQILISQPSGSNQSPVNLTTSDAVSDALLGPLVFNYSGIWVTSREDNSLPTVSPQPSMVQNSGLGWQVQPPPHYQLLLHGGPLHSSNYRLDHYLAHWGSSEHSVDGKSYHGEIQLVHYHIKYDNLTQARGHSEGVAIVSFLLEKDDDNPNDELEKIGQVLPQIGLKGQSSQTAEVVNLDNMLPNNRNYLTYSGSSTVPPYTEGVLWIMLTQPVGVSSRCLSRMCDLQYGGDDSAKIAYNCKSIISLGDRKIFKPVDN